MLSFYHDNLKMTCSKDDLNPVLHLQCGMLVIRIHNERVNKEVNVL